MRRLFLFVSLLTLFVLLPGNDYRKASVRGASLSNSWLDGTWEGTGFQLSDGSTWKIRLHCKSANNEFLIEYPTLRCGGKWILLSSDSHMAKFTETITQGLESCANGGLLVITRIDGNYITYSYFSHPGKALEAYSTLRKRNE